MEVDRGAHQGGTADCLAPALCEVCQHSYGELGPHHFVDQVNEYRLKSAATCTSPAVYYQSCSTCGAQGTETFTNGEPLGHDYGAWTSNGDGTHTRVCTVDGCSAGTQTENCIDANKDHKCDYCGKKLTEHTGGKATCKDKAKCEVCGAEYGELDPKNHTNLKHFPAKAATKTTEGNIEYWYCSGCGKYFADKDGTKEITKADTVTAKLPSHTGGGTGIGTGNKPGNDTVASSNTGDSSKLALWSVTLCGSLAACLTLTAAQRRRKKEQ